MDCRFPLDSLACGTQENDSDIPQEWRGIEKAGSGCPGDEFLGLVKGWLGAGGTLWEKTRARRARLGQTDVYLQPPEGYKTNSGGSHFTDHGSPTEIPPAAPKKMIPISHRMYAPERN